MSDIADLAAKREQEMREDALAKRRRAWCTGKSESLLQCESCSEGIPLQRRLAVPGVRLCINCQSRLEQQQRRGLA